MTKPNTSFKYSTKAKSRLDIVIGTLLLITFILIITRLAVKGTPSTRTNTWGLAVCLKSALSLAYQIITAHVNRFKKWASTKANEILTVVDTVFWLALFVITIMGTAGSSTTVSRALGVIIAIFVFVLCGVTAAVCYISVCVRRYYKRYGVLPADGVGNGYTGV